MLLIEVDELREPWCVTGGVFSDCVVDFCMTVFVFDLRLLPSPFWISCLTVASFSFDSDSCLALLICLDFVFDLCLVFFRL